MTRTVQLSVNALISLVQKENLGEPHAVLAGGERYVSPRFHDPTTHWDEGLRDKVALVHRARVEHYGWITDGDETSAVLVAGSGRAAVVLTREGEQVKFERADPDRLVEALINRLPQVPAGRGESIAIRAGDYGSANKGVLREPVSARSQEARRLDALLRAPRLGGARLYTARRDRAGARNRAKEWITVLDLVGQGRWAVYTTQGRGERAINAVPASPWLLVKKLTELQRSLS